VIEMGLWQSQCLVNVVQRAPVRRKTMSKNATLGMIVKAAVSVPDQYGEVAAKLLSWLAHDHPQAAEHHQQLDDFLAGHAQIVPLPLLSDEGLHLVVPSEAYSIDWDAFQRRPDVYCYDGFKALIQKDQVAKPAERSIAIGRVNLQRGANDTLIRRELPADHPLQLQEFAWAILSGGAKQDGRWNVGYVLIGGRVCVVDAYWFSDDGEWRAGRHVLFSDSRPQAV